MKQHSLIESYKINKYVTYQKTFVSIKVFGLLHKQHVIYHKLSYNNIFVLILVKENGW